MCLIAFAWNAQPGYRLIVGANRDEWHERPTLAAHWWEDHPDIFAGRDLQAGGTWLGVSRAGRFAALTNFRDPSDRKSDAPSRGNLVSNFLRGDVSAREYLLDLQRDAAKYQGFNLLLGTADELFYFSSRAREIVAVPNGVHAISNHMLDEPWPKVDQSKLALEAVLQTKMAGDARKTAIYDFLSNDVRAADEVLPDTGVGLEWERVLSPAMIVTPKYGTRCSTVLSISSSGEIDFEERTRDSAGNITGAASAHFFTAS